MSVPPEADVAEHVRRLKDLGYTIVDVTPPLGGYGPPQAPRPRLPDLRAVDRIVSQLRSSAE